MSKAIKVLVTGSEGQLSKSFKSIEKFYETLEIDFLSKTQLNILDFASIDKITIEKKYDFILNFAAYTAVDDAEINQVTALEVNSYGPRNLAKICSKNNIFLIHISTDYVFDGKSELFYSEDCIPRPCNYYGESKLLGEEFVSSLSPRYLILRVSWLYSEFSKNFFLTMINLAKEKDTISVVNDQFGTPTYATDFSFNLIKIINHLYKNGFYEETKETFHYSNLGVTTWYDFAEEIFSLQGLDIELNKIDTKSLNLKATRPHNSSLSVSKVIEYFDLQIPEWNQSLINCCRNYQSRAFK